LRAYRIRKRKPSHIFLVPRRRFTRGVPRRDPRWRAEPRKESRDRDARQVLRCSLLDWTLSGDVIEQRARIGEEGGIGDLGQRYRVIEANGFDRWISCRMACRSGNSSRGVILRTSR